MHDDLAGITQFELNFVSSFVVRYSRLFESFDSSALSLLSMIFV